MSQGEMTIEVKDEGEDLQLINMATAISLNCSSATQPGRRKRSLKLFLIKGNH